MLKKGQNFLINTINRNLEHKKIKITPHIASVTNAEAGAKQIIENYERNLKKIKLINEVDIKKGY